MEINSQQVYSAHPVNVQAALRTDMQVQDRGPDSLPPANSAKDSSGSDANYEDNRSSGRYLDTRA